MPDIFIYMQDLQLIAPTQNGRVTARNLYEFLGLNKSQIARWLNTNILKNKFAFEGEDFWGFDTMSSGNKITDFYLTVDFAKRLAMQAKSEMGEKARQYFLECEKVAKQKPQALPDYPTALRQLATQYEVNQILEKQLKEAEDERLTLLDRKINVDKVKDLKGTIRAFKDDEGRTANSYVIKHFFDGKGVSYSQAHVNAKEAYYKATGEKLPHYADKMSLEQKKSYRRFLSSL